MVTHLMGEEWSFRKTRWWPHVIKLATGTPRIHPISRNSTFGISFPFPVKIPRTFHLTSSFQTHTGRTCGDWALAVFSPGILFWNCWLGLQGSVWGRRFGQNEQTLGGDKGQGAFSSLPCVPFSPCSPPCVLREDRDAGHQERKLSSSDTKKPEEGG